MFEQVRFMLIGIGALDLSPVIEELQLLGKVFISFNEPFGNDNYAYKNSGSFVQVLFACAL
jgi:hypothetical protein